MPIRCDAMIMWNTPTSASPSARTPRTPVVVLLARIEPQVRNLGITYLVLHSDIPHQVPSLAYDEKLKANVSVRLHYQQLQIGTPP
jgi:hypothetical protein